ncbi:MAG: efflux RND transporter periplasmic adaptor subunit [Alphaproteobacteria bacterium]
MAVLGLVAGGGYWYAVERPAAESAAERAPSGAAQAQQPPPQAPRAAPVVEVAAVQLGSVVRSIGSVGTLQSNESVIIRPEIVGRIASIDFREGERAEKGQILFRLDDSVYRAELAEAEARLQLARRNAERASELFDRRVGTARTRDEATAALSSGQAAVALARARLDKTRVAAPFGGVLGLRRVSLGDYVNPGQDIVNLEDIDPIKVDFRVPEPSLRDVREGQTIEVALDAYPGEAFPGTVFAIDPRIDMEGRSIVLRARLDNPDGRLRPGLFARVNLVVDRTDAATLIPEEAIVPVEGGNVVFRVVDGKAERVPVRIGQRRMGQVQILDGLSVGDSVIVAGQMRVRDGAAVTTRPAAVGS